MVTLAIIGSWHYFNWSCFILLPILRINFMNGYQFIVMYTPIALVKSNSCLSHVFTMHVYQPCELNESEELNSENEKRNWVNVITPFGITIVPIFLHIFRGWLGFRDERFTSANIVYPVLSILFIEKESLTISSLFFTGSSDRRTTSFFIVII